MKLKKLFVINVKIKKVTVCIMALLTVSFALAACGKSYLCDACDKTTSRAYYNVTGSSTLCGDCAREYWAPLDYKEYRIK